jgi:hypothetical protein
MSAAEIASLAKQYSNPWWNGRTDFAGLVTLGKLPESVPVPTKVKDRHPRAWLLCPPRGIPMTMKRNRQRPELSLQERLQKFAREARATAKALPPSVERSEQLARARDGEAAAKIDLWLSSPGLRRPK